MRVAIIDLGTNSVRFDVNYFGPNRQTINLHREKIMVRLGEGVFVRGKLSRIAVQRTVRAFIRFKKMAEQLRASRILAFGTSALRDARDSAKLIHIIHKKCGIELKVISGKEEARLIALGILKNQKIPFKRFALLDIGGGSTELSLCTQKNVTASQSFQLGTARLQQVFLKCSPPDPKDIERLRKFVRRLLNDQFPGKRRARVNGIIGSSGTIRAISRIFRKLDHTSVIRKGRLKALIQKMGLMTSAELLKLPGIEGKRVDMILAGALLLEECMRVLAARAVYTTDYSLRDGILEEERSLVLSKRRCEKKAQMEELEIKSIQFGKEKNVLKKIEQSVDLLFDQFRHVHGLNRKWKPYLIGAAWLRDIGQIVNVTKYAEMSYVLIQNFDLDWAEEWEIDLISNLCLFHCGAKNGEESLSFSNKKVGRNIFLKLLALLKMIDILEIFHDAPIRLEEVLVKAKSVHLIVSRKDWTGLENLYFDTHRDFFKSVFGRSLVVSQSERSA